MLRPQQGKGNSKWGKVRVRLPTLPLMQLAPLHSDVAQTVQPRKLRAAFANLALNIKSSRNFDSCCFLYLLSCLY